MFRGLGFRVEGCQNDGPLGYKYWDYIGLVENKNGNNYTGESNGKENGK